MSDALFGVDGTELPEPLPDPSGRGGSGWPPLTLPALPNSRMTWEEIAAALGEDPTRPVNHDPGAALAAPPGITPTDTFPAPAPSVPVPPLTVPSVAPTAPLPAHSAPQAGGAPAATAPARPSRSVAPTTVAPAQPTPDLRYRPPLAVGSRMPRQLDLRRRVGRRGPGLSPNPRSNGGATLFFLVAFIVCGVLTYGVIAGIVESLARLVP
jgi:hypothetical protein